MRQRFTYATSQERKETLIRQAKSQLCVDCLAAGLPGVWPTESMQLDHLPEYKKRFNLSKKNSNRWATGDLDYNHFSVAEIIEEISHCQPVCGNHHSIRTNARRRKSWQQEQAGQGVLTVEQPRHHLWYELLLRHNPNIWD